MTKKLLKVAALTPVRAKLRDVLTVVTVAYVLFAGTSTLYFHQYAIIDWIYYETSYQLDEPIIWLVALALVATLTPPAYLLLGVLLSKRKTITITLESIKFRRWGRMLAFDRSLPSRFVLRNHDRAEAERDRHDHLQDKARLKGKARKPRKYYQVSHILALEHVGEAHDIMPIYGERTAKNILARLNAVMAQMDGAARNGRGVSFSPQDEWHDAAGGLPKSPRS